MKSVKIETQYRDFNTVGELKQILAKFPDDMPIDLFGILEPQIVLETGNESLVIQPFYELDEDDDDDDDWECCPNCGRNFQFDCDRCGYPDFEEEEDDGE